MESLKEEHEKLSISEEITVKSEFKSYFIVKNKNIHENVKLNTI